MINEVRNTVSFILNKENNGYITPEAFNSYAKQVQIELLEQAVYDYNNAMYRMNRRMSGTGLGDIPKYVKECVDKLMVYNEILTFDVTHFDLPTIAGGNANEWFRIMNVSYNYATDVERVEANQIMNLNNSMLMAPSTSFPVYVQQADEIYVYPTSIQADILADYIRYPKDPKWTYSSLSAGEPLFDQGASDYQDFELPLSYMPKIIVKILQYAGVSIRESEVVQAAKSEEIYNKQQEQ